MTNNAFESGTRTARLVGQFMTCETMSVTEKSLILLSKILLLLFIFLTLIAWLVAYFLRKKKIIKDGDMKLQNDKKMSEFLTFYFSI